MPIGVNLSLIDQDAPNASNAAYEEEEWYLNDHTALCMDTTLHDSEWYINDLETSDVTDASNREGKWYLNETEELAYSPDGAPDSSHTDKLQIPQEVSPMTTF